MHKEENHQNRFDDGYGKRDYRIPSPQINKRDAPGKAGAHHKGEQDHNVKTGRGV
jgi:hypothetical protein